MEDELMEVFVDYKDGFVEVLKPAGKALKDYFKELQVHLPKGFRTEVNLEATEWIKEIAVAVKKGYVITIDYGYPSAELYRDYRRTGTLLCYNNHTINENPFVDVGEQDITTHVNFSAVIHWGLEYGLEYCGFTDQGNFLLCLGFKEELRRMIQEPGPDYMNFKKEIFLTQTLLLDMGRKFKVLIQGKNIPKQKLRGLQLSLVNENLNQ
jgi:SAM-dependent MidA family methyltransferase